MLRVLGPYHPNFKLHYYRSQGRCAKLSSASTHVGTTQRTRWSRYLQSWIPDISPRCEIMCPLKRVARRISIRENSRAQKIKVSLKLNAEVSTRSSRISTSEALLRTLHPHFVLVPPFGRKPAHLQESILLSYFFSSHHGSDLFHSSIYWRLQLRWWTNLGHMRAVRFATPHASLFDLTSSFIWRHRYRSLSIVVHT
jgi:hypothetical protein